MTIWKVSIKCDFSNIIAVSLELVILPNTGVYMQPPLSMLQISQHHTQLTSHLSLIYSYHHAPIFSYNCYIM